MPVVSENLFKCTYSEKKEGIRKVLAEEIRKRSRNILTLKRK